MIEQTPRLLLTKIMATAGLDAFNDEHVASVFLGSVQDSVNICPGELEDRLTEGAAEWVQDGCIGEDQAWGIVKVVAPDTSIASYVKCNFEYHFDGYWELRDVYFVKPVIETTYERIEDGK